MVAIAFAIYLWESTAGALPGEISAIDAWRGQGERHSITLLQFLQGVVRLGDTGAAVPAVLVLTAVIWEEVGARAATGVIASASVVLVAGIGVALLIPVLAIGPAVLLLGSHPPSDALGGYALGAAWAIGATVLTRR